MTASQHESLISPRQPLAKRRSTLVIIALVLTSVLLVLVIASWLSGGFSQQRVIDALNAIGESANQRTGALYGECAPAYRLNPNADP
jgi:hypothetical protein